MRPYEIAIADLDSLLTDLLNEGIGGAVADIHRKRLDEHVKKEKELDAQVDELFALYQTKDDFNKREIDRDIRQPVIDYRDEELSALSPEQWIKHYLRLHIEINGFKEAKSHITL